MPSFFDEAQMHNALRIEALPELARLADNERLRDRAVLRFDRDETPPYVSSTEDDDEFGYEPPLGLEGGALLDEFAGLITPPLTGAERDWVATDLSYTRNLYNPGERYHREALVEAERERTLRWKLRPANAAAGGFLDFWGRPGEERLNIIVRRNIKRRWQKLGVWNPRWGIPGRHNRTNADDDDKSKWKWRWQHSDDAADWTMSTTPTATNPHHPITRAVMLRRGLHRIPTLRRRHHTDSIAKAVIEWWKSRGDWRDDWDNQVGATYVPGWKWRHESPSPEPEDITPLETMDLEFTPSEADALEAIAPPTPPPPRPPSPKYYPRGDPRYVPGTSLFATPPPPDVPPVPPQPPRRSARIATLNQAKALPR